MRSVSCHHANCWSASVNASQYEAEGDEHQPPRAPPYVEWTLESIKAHHAYPKYLQHMRVENQDDHWEITEEALEEEIEMWVEWLAGEAEDAMRKCAAAEAAEAAEADGAEGEAAAVMDIDAPRGATRPAVAAAAVDLGQPVGQPEPAPLAPAAARPAPAAARPAPTGPAPVPLSGIQLASLEAAERVEMGDVLEIYKDSKTLFGTCTVDKVVMKGDSITAEISWDDGDASNRELILYTPSQGSTTWPRWQLVVTPFPLFMRIAKSQGDLMRAPTCADACAPPATATPTGIFGFAIDSGRLDNSFLATGLAGKCSSHLSHHPICMPHSLTNGDEPPGCLSPCEHGPLCGSCCSRQAPQSPSHPHPP
jgi:hypothetical protein